MHPIARHQFGMRQTALPADPAQRSFGDDLRRLRAARRLSQLDLALTSDVSARHISFLESGRASPSRDMVLQLGHALRLPGSGLNALLQSAGFAPVFRASSLASSELAPFRRIVDEMIARHAPYPALVLDRLWNVLEANSGAQLLLGPLQAASPEPNIVRLLADSPQAETMIPNLPEVLAELARRIRAEMAHAGMDHQLADLLALIERRLAHLPMVDRARPGRAVVPVQIATPLGEIRLLTVMAHFGASDDITVQDLRIELLFPADEASANALKALPAQS